MGEYRDGKWVPTWGDDQFGVVDSPTQMYSNLRDKDAEIERLRADHLKQTKFHTRICTERDTLRAALDRGNAVIAEMRLEGSESADRWADLLDEAMNGNKE